MELRELSVHEIEALSLRPSVRRIAVENFLGSMGNNYEIAVSNLQLDASLYHWNAATYRAIMDGIKLAREGAEK